MTTIAVDKEDDRTEDDELRFAPGARHPGAAYGLDRP